VQEGWLASQWQDSALHLSEVQVQVIRQEGVGIVERGGGGEEHLSEVGVQVLVMEEEGAAAGVGAAAVGGADGEEAVGGTKKGTRWTCME